MGDLVNLRQARKRRERDRRRRRRGPKSRRHRHDQGRAPDDRGRAREGRARSRRPPDRPPRCRLSAAAPESSSVPSSSPAIAPAFRWRTRSGGASRRLRPAGGSRSTVLPRKSTPRGARPTSRPRSGSLCSKRSRRTLIRATPARIAGLPTAYRRSGVKRTPLNCVSVEARTPHGTPYGSAVSHRVRQRPGSPEFLHKMAPN